MLVLHVYIQGKNGSIERSYDFLRNDGKDTFEGCDVIVPYDKEIAYPMNERDTLSQLYLLDRSRGDH